MANTQANNATGTAAPALDVREKPIFMSGEMARAILGGIKTMTRRVVVNRKRGGTWAPLYQPQLKNGLWSDSHCEPFRCPYGAPGDRLWVREAFGLFEWFGDHWEPARLGHEAQSVQKFYAADQALPDQSELKWRPSIHMPRWASRITLEITDVRVERLQAITEEDAKAEGAPWLMVPLREEGPTPATITVHGHRMGFAKLWNQTQLGRPYRDILKTAPWSSNPWVWKIEFRRAQ